MLETAPKILLVDDSSHNLTLLERVLSNEDYIIRKAGTGEKALEIVVQEKFDLILLDLELPDIPGFEVCRIIKEKLKLIDIPIIFLTMKTDKNTIMTAFDLGGVDFITKPFSYKEVIARCRVHINLKKVKEELEEKNKKLNELILMDSLTGLYNHNYIYQRLEEEIEKSERYKKNLAVIMFDIDDFKKINDNYGHIKGDEILKKVAEYLKNSFRRVDIVGRYGGEEFMIILPETDFEKACLSAERARKNIANRNFALDKNVTVSGGVAQFLHGENTLILVDRADKGMYKAKNNGKNRVEIENI